MRIHAVISARRAAGLAGGLLLAAALGACVVRPAPYGYGGGYGGGYGDEAYVTVAPPPVQMEVVGVAPAPGYFWIGGFWNWVGGRHQWVPGRWEAPREGYRYVGHRWTQDGGGWRMHPGHWEAARGGHEEGRGRERERDRR